MVSTMILILKSTLAHVRVGCVLNFREKKLKNGIGDNSYEEKGRWAESLGPEEKEKRSP